MDWIERLIEARMRDWERRVREGTAPPPPEQTALAPGLEVQLWQEILSLRALAAERPGEVGDLARCRDRETQLWILLERSGRPLAAARLQALLATT
ncbi:MAG: hypothetical protein H6738_09380 [Alphaproteobacteria bacterium]|nr:hypothetical protein [Alphaproteobacteria bacterium]